MGNLTPAFHKPGEVRPSSPTAMLQLQYSRIVGLNSVAILEKPLHELKYWEQMHKLLISARIIVWATGP
jgi:hypothetical protein